LNKIVEGVENMFNTPLARELSELLYLKLKNSKDGELSFNEILDVFQTDSNYGLARVNGGAINLLKERKDVEQLKDEKGRPFLKLI
jgi:hypothetical protein